MDQRSTSTTTSIGGAAAYRIVVQGELDENLSERLAGMSIRVSHGQHRGTVTALEGRILDQAQLVGVLNALYELRVPILDVSSLPEDEDAGVGPVERAEC